MQKLSGLLSRIEPRTRRAKFLMRPLPLMNFDSAPMWLIHKWLYNNKRAFLLLKEDHMSQLLFFDSFWIASTSKEFSFSHLWHLFLWKLLAPNVEPMRRTFEESQSLFRKVKSSFNILWYSLILTLGETPSSFVSIYSILMSFLILKNWKFIIKTTFNYKSDKITSIWSSKFTQGN